MTICSTWNIPATLQPASISFRVDFLPVSYYNPPYMRRHLLCLAVSAGFALTLSSQTAPAPQSPPTAQTSAPSAPAVAKADTSQESLVFDRIYNLIRFEDDGTGVRDTTAVVRVQSQAGVQQMGQLIFGYSSATENLEIQYVRVRKPDGRVIETPPASAQDFAPDVLQEAPTYTDYRQRHISIVGLQAGDVLEYRTLTHVTKPLAEHEFWYEHNFPEQVVVHEDKLEIDIPKDRAVKLKSPKRKYETRETADRRIYTWNIPDFVPDRKRIQDEDDDSSDQPDVQLSTFDNWEQVSKWYAKLQGERVTVDDTLRKKAQELTKGATTPAEKAQRLYDYVARNIRYVSLSFGVGRLQPHLAPEIMQNGFGDCKDKHTLLQALLRAEGVQSYPVLINSARKIDVDIPSPGQFDHEITAVKLGENLTWLDATTEVAPYGLILYQLRNKEALLASDEAVAPVKGGLVKTPAASPVKNQLTVKMDGKFSEAGALDLTIEMTSQGDSDVPMRSAFRGTPEARWQDLLLIFSRSWGLDGEVSDVHVDSVEDTTKPFHARYHLHKSDYFRVPNSGINFRLLPPLRVPSPRRAGRKNATEPLDVGPAGDTVYRAHIVFPPNYSLSMPSNSIMRRDYGEYSSSYDLVKNVLDAERHLQLKVNELPASKRADYESFRNATGNELEQLISCSITAPSGTASASTAKPTGSPQEMQDSGAAALQRRDFAAAVDFLKSTVDQEPSRKDAWDQLGRAYAGLNQHDQAIAAFRKQIEIDEYHPRANNDLAAELQQQGKLDEAAAAYRKQTEITPYDKLPHKSLGLLLVQMKRDEDARPELEAAAAIPPEDPEVKMALAQVYSRTGNAEKAAALMKGVTGVSAASAGGDVYASALKDDVDPNQTVREARHTLAEIGDQFDSGEYDRLGPSAFSAMNLVALAWARIGWAGFLRGEDMEAMQYLNSAWLLSQSGTVGNRLARLMEKEGQKDKARHMYALALAAGGAEAEASRQGVAKLAASPAAAEKEISDAGAELVQERTVQLPSLTTGTASAKFALVFDNATKPERADFQDGDAALNGASQQLQQKSFPVKFPDVSSIKIVCRATLSCAGSKCTAALLPPEGMAASAPASASK